MKLIYILLLILLGLFIFCLCRQNPDHLIYKNFINTINNDINISELIKDPIGNKIIFTIWTNDNDLTQNRYAGLLSLKRMKDITMINVNKDNLHLFIHDNSPIHPAYKYLSTIHKADYLRCYLMHHWGGGYSDIKKHTDMFKWSLLFDKIKNDNNLWLIGLSNDFNLAFSKDNSKLLNDELNKNYTKMVGIGYFIYKPNTKITSEWFYKLNLILDNYL